MAPRQKRRGVFLLHFSFDDNRSLTASDARNNTGGVRITRVCRLLPHTVRRTRIRVFDKRVRFFRRVLKSIFFLFHDGHVSRVFVTDTRESYIRFPSGYFTPTFVRTEFRTTFRHHAILTYRYIFSTNRLNTIFSNITVYAH